MLFGGFDLLNRMNSGCINAWEVNNCRIQCFYQRHSEAKITNMTLAIVLCAFLLFPGPPRTRLMPCSSPLKV